MGIVNFEILTNIYGSTLPNKIDHYDEISSFNIVPKPIKFK